MSRETKNQLAWEEKFKELDQHLKDNPEDKAVKKAARPLRKWLQTNRALYREDRLIPNRRDQLNSLGIAWNPVNEYWDSRIELLHQYSVKNGHCRIKKWENNEWFGLYKWVKRQKERYRAGSLSKEELEKLQGAGLVLTSEDALEQGLIGRIKEYKAQNGNVDITVKSEKDWPGLYKSILQLRYAYKKGKLSDEKLALYKKLGVKFNTWSLKLEQYKEFLGSNKNHQDPKAAKKLRHWANCQRQLYNKGELSKSRINRLKAVGFDFEPVTQHSIRWELLFQSLKEYVERHGLPVSKKEKVLSQWVQSQRKLFRWDKLSNSRIEKLNSLGLGLAKENVFDPKWIKIFNEVKEYIAKHGHTNFGDLRSSSGTLLRSWYLNNRLLFANKRLSQEREQLFKDIYRQNIRVRNRKVRVSAIREQSWESSFQQLGKCIEKNGFPVGKTDRKLHRWVQRQRDAYRKNKLSNSRIEKLNSLGLGLATEYIHDIRWNDIFGEVKEHIAKHGYTNFGNSRANDGTLLSVWYLNNSRKFVLGQLPSDRQKMFNELDLGDREVKARKLWSGRLEELICYAKDHPEDIDLDYASKSLRLWFLEQRRSYRNGTLSEEKERGLATTGLMLSSEQLSYAKKVSQLKQYKKLHGHCHVVAPNNNKWAGLALWLRSQKKLYSDGELEKDRVDELVSLGVEWEPSYDLRRWYDLYIKLEGYYKKNSSGRITPPLDIYPRCLKLKDDYSAGIIPSRIVEKFKSIGFDFRQKATFAKAWDESVAMVKAFIEEHGHCDFDKEKSDLEKKLFYWKASILAKVRKGELSQEKMDELKEINLNVSINLQEKHWDENNSQLRTYLKNNPEDKFATKAPKSLHGWVTLQTLNFRHGTLSLKRSEKLQDSGLDLSFRNISFKLFLGILKDHIGINGDSAVDVHDQDRFLIWFSIQMDKYSGKELPKNQEKEIKKLNLDGNLTSRPHPELSEKFSRFLTVLTKYVERKGHCRVCKKDEREWPGLYKWVSALIALNRRGVLSDKKKEMVGGLGFEWV